MDLIGGLVSSMGLEQNQAQALAGAVMANVAGQVADNDTEAATVLESKVPEMGGWMAAAKGLLGGAAEPEPEPESGGLMGSLMGLAGSGVGNQLLGAVAGKEAQNAAMLAGVISKLGIDESKAMMAAPMVLTFLESRLDKGTLDTILSYAPMLTGGSPAPSGGSGGVMGALGGLLGN